MRDKNLSYLVFKEQFDKQLNKKFLTLFSKDIKILRTPVVDSPTFLSEYELLLPRKFVHIRGLCLLWEKLPEVLQFEVFLRLEKEIEKFDFKKQLELKFLLNPETRYIFLFSSQRYSSYEIFGNLIQESLEAFEKIRIFRRNKKIRYPQRKRGYNDKGTLRSFDIWSHRWKPFFDWSLTDLQNQIERNLALRQKHFLRIRNSLRILLIKEMNNLRD